MIKKVIYFTTFFTILLISVFITKEYTKQQYKQEMKIALGNQKINLQRECEKTKKFEIAKTKKLELIKYKEIYKEKLNEIFINRKKDLEKKIQRELKYKVNLAYELANQIYTKYKNKRTKHEIKEMIKFSLSKMAYEYDNDYIFITDFNGNSILKGSQKIDTNNLAAYLDMDARSIVLEEIQKVKKRGEGFLYSSVSNSYDKEIIYVKNLGFYDWFIGSSKRVKTQEEKLKAEFSSFFDII
jgi:hypothetical protein